MKNVERPVGIMQHIQWSKIYIDLFSMQMKLKRWVFFPRASYSFDFFFFCVCVSVIWGSSVMT